jgi:leucyl aminopeptidase
MDASLQVRLRVLIPAVENAISASSYRPGDIVKTRKGLNIEVVNTDAEGRVILAGALAEADSDVPDLLIECSTLTGAAKLALGNEGRLDVHARRCARRRSAGALDARSRPALANAASAVVPQAHREPGRRPVPLSNMADDNYVEHTRSWVHLDIFAWNDRAVPGRRIGGEATGMRALFDLVESRFGASGR